MRAGEVIEIATATLKPETSRSGFLTASARMQREFLETRPGFLDRVLYEDEGGVWGGLLTWASLKEAQAALGESMQHESVREFAAHFLPGTYAVRWVGVAQAYPRREQSVVTR